MSPTKTLSTRSKGNPQDYAKVQALIRGYLARKAYKKLVKKQVHRGSVAKEIFKTEQSYVRSLETMIEVYLVPLREDPKKYGITKEEFHIIFANIETIVNLHKEMLKILEERISKWDNVQKIGDIFIKFAPFLKMLNGYCSNYDNAITTLTQARQERRPFAAFLEKCELTESVHILPAYLIQPIQRVPRYNLLLEELIRSTWEWHNDYEGLCNALRAMKQIADHINESLHISDKANKVVKIQSDLGGEVLLVEPHRRWMKDGAVTRIKRQGRTSSPVSTNKLWIYLFNDVIVFAGRILLSYRFIEKYPLNSTSVQDIPGSPQFQMASVDAQSAYILAMETEEQKNEWLVSISNAIQDYSESIPNIKVEQRKTIDRESSLSVPHNATPSHSSAPPSTNPHVHTATPTHTSLPAQAQFQQQLAHKLQQRSTQSTQIQPQPAHTQPTHAQPTQTQPTPYVPQPAHMSQPAQQTPAALSGVGSPQRASATQKPAVPPRLTMNTNLMKFDFSSMPITEEGDDSDEEEEMTFAERRLMFERGLLPQAQVAAPPPRRPVGKLSSNPNANNINKLAAQDKRRVESIPLPGLAPAPSKITSPRSNNSVSKPNPTSTTPRSHDSAEIPPGIVGERKRKYTEPSSTTNNSEMNTPLLADKSDTNNKSKATGGTAGAPKETKKESGCCVIL